MGSQAVLAGASEAAGEECSPIDDPLRGSVKYKREMVRVYTMRAIELSVARAMGRERREKR